MHRKSGRTSLVYPCALCASLLMFAVPDTSVNALRASVYSLLTPLLRITATSNRSPEPRTASIGIELGQKTPTEESGRVIVNKSEEYDRLSAECVLLVDRIRRLQSRLPPKDAELTEPTGINADVVARRTMWQEPLLGLDKGTAEGVRNDAGVMHRGAVVGRIIATGPHFSSMALLTDKSMRIGARLVDCRVEGILQGMKAGEGTERFCRLQIVAKELKAVVGEHVVTSGLDSTFPAGLWLGVVMKINRTSDFQWELIVRPACDENKIETVHVLVGETPEVPWPQMPGTKTAPKNQNSSARK
ncbi:MAG: rod shape-determining protein MreC [Planctomycetota bacterium]